MDDKSVSAPVPKRADELVVGDRIPGDKLPYRFAKGPAEIIFACDATTLGDSEEWTFIAYRHEDGYHDSTTVLSGATFPATPAADPTGLLHSRADEAADPQPSGGREPLHTGAMTDGGLVDDGEYLVSHGPVKPPYGSPERAAYDETHPDPTGLDEVSDVDLRETIHWRSSGLPHMVIACGAESGPHSADLDRVTCPACLDQVRF